MWYISCQSMGAEATNLQSVFVSGGAYNPIVAALPTWHNDCTGGRDTALKEIACFLTHCIF